MNHMLRFVLPALVLVGSLAALSPAALGQQSEDKPRVFLRVNRNVEIKGYIEQEDDNVIVVRDLLGELHSFSKSRVGQIVRLVDPEPDQRGVVYLLNGQYREGIVLEDAFDYVLLEIEGIHARLKREHVDFLKLEPTLMEQYEHFKQALNPTMYERHLALCRWLVDNKMYELAEKELKKLLARTELPDAQQLQRLVRAQLALSEPATEDAADDLAFDNPYEESEAGPVTVRDMLPSEIITHHDVNIIRVYEIDFDHAPRVELHPDSIRRFIEQYGSSPNMPRSQTERTQLFRADPIEVVKLMFEHRARDLYRDINVLSEPYSLNLFRQRVHNTWLMNNCATSRCHGGLEGGRFFLHRRGSRDERVRYTNFLILDRLQLDPEWPLINYDQPERSLILQYGMQREVALKPHPDVRGWNPVFRPTGDRQLAAAIEWIRTMMQPRPEYPVEYTPPTLGISLNEKDEGETGRTDR